MALNFNNIKKKQSQQEPSQVNPISQPGFNLAFTNGKTYDLDEIIAEKLRSNSDSALRIKVLTDDNLQNKLIELVSKKILDDYNISYTNDNYKSQVSKVAGFSQIFDIYYSKYYDAYVAAINQDSYDGSISIDTILREINLTKADVKNYTLKDVEAAQDTFLMPNKYRPVIIWTDGTDDPGDVEPSESVLYRDELYSYLNEALISKNSSLTFTKNNKNKQLEADLVGVASSRDLDNVNNKLDSAFDQIELLKGLIDDSDGGGYNVTTIDKILIDENGNLISDPTAVPSVKAVYSLMTGYLSGIGRKIVPNGDGYALYVNKLSLINDEQISASSLDKFILNENGDYSLKLFNTTVSYINPQKSDLSISTSESGDYVLHATNTYLINNSDDYGLLVYNAEMRLLSNNEYALIVNK